MLLQQLCVLFGGLLLHHVLCALGLQRSSAPPMAPLCAGTATRSSIQPISWWLVIGVSSSAAFALVPLLLSQQALDYLSKVISAAGVVLLLTLEMAMEDHLHLPLTENLRAVVRGAAG